MVQSPKSKVQSLRGAMRNLDIGLWTLDMHRDESGSISLATVVALLLLTMLLGMVINVGRQIDNKVKLQNTADTATYSGGVLLARGMNSLAYTNHMLTEVFALTAFMREARDRRADQFVPE